MKTVHWLGAGLSSRPGFNRIRDLKGSPLVLWSRDPDKARAWCSDSPSVSHFRAVSAMAASRVSSRLFDWDDLENTISPGDCVVSMLPATMHLQVAEICLRRRAHLVTTSYLSPTMRELDSHAKALGLCFLNEMGLDPGIDHLFAHSLIHDFDQTQVPDAPLRIQFTSVCGGFPAAPDGFKYRFSWSPLGALRALKNPSLWIEDGAERKSRTPREAIQNYSFADGVLEMYPNRDSLQYIGEYGVDRLGQVDRFVRGTLRPAGWAMAWRDLFSEIERAGEEELAAIANRLGAKFMYGADEADRVCLQVKLSAEEADSGRLIYEKSLTLDETGTPGGDSAMARTVSLMASIGVEGVLSGRLAAGVSGFPRDPQWMKHCFAGLENCGIKPETTQTHPIRSFRNSQNSPFCQ